MPTASWPATRSVSVRCEPTNPAAPVTIARIGGRVLPGSGVRERFQPLRPALEDHLREEPRHQDTLPEVAEARLGPLAARESQRQAGEPRAGGGRKREAPAEAGVDVGDRQRAV